MMRQTFRKSERLCSKTIISRLFQKGSTTGPDEATRTFYLFPFRVICLFDDARTEPLPAILITVSKRQFKRAVDRNLIRRRIREAYRINKPLLFGTTDQPKQPPAYIAFLYTAKQIISFEEIEKSMKLVLQKVSR